MAVKEGAKWGALVCTFAGGIKTTINTGGGCFSEQYLTHYVFDCECGGKLKVLAAEFKGKRLTQDCGCGIGTQGTSEVLTVTVPKGLKSELRERANAEGTNLSHMTAKMLRQGLKQKGVEA